MPVHRTSIEDLIVEVHSAALEPERWSRVVRQLAQRHDAHVGVLFTPLRGMHDRYLLADHGIDPAITKSYGEFWHQYDAWNVAGLARGQLDASAVFVGESIVSQADLVRTPFYNELLKAMDVRHLAAAVVFDDSDVLAPRTYLTLMRSPDAGMFDCETTAELRVLAPHLRCALKTHWLLQQERAVAALREAALDATPAATMWLSPTGKILLANAAAREMLDSGNLLRSRNGQLLAWGARASQPLRDALAQACAGAAVTVALALEGRFVARLLPPRPFEADGKALCGVLLQIESTDSIADHSVVDSLGRLYNLTRSECDTLARLANGATPSEIGEESQILISTVRTHLRSLFRKTGLRRQADLVRLVTAHVARTTRSAATQAR